MTVVSESGGITRLSRTSVGNARYKESIDRLRAIISEHDKGNIEFTRLKLTEENEHEAYPTIKVEIDGFIHGMDVENNDAGHTTRPHRIACIDTNREEVTIQIPQPTASRRATGPSQR